MSSLRYANARYFWDGDFEKDLSNGIEPILIDPHWQNTILSELLSQRKELIQIKKPDSFWIATSGSTGNPKLIQKSLEQLNEEVKFWKSQFHSIFGWDLPQNPRWVVTVPFCHLYGLIWGHLFPLEMKWDVISIRHLSELGTEDLENTYLISTPNQIQNSHFEGVPLPKYIFSSGSKFPAELARILREEGKTEVREIYGCTEAGAMGTRDPFWKARFSILPIVETRVCKEEGGHSLEVKSKFVSTTALELNEGDWNQVSLVDEDGYFPTKDWGDFSSLGWNHIGRIDRIAKIKSKRISLDLVESLLLSLKTVSEAAVICFEEKEEWKLGCYLILKEKENEENLRNKMKEHLPLSHIPEKIRITDSIPKLANRKTDYLLIKKEFEKII